MGKSSKKRNKKYTGANAKSVDNSVRVHKVNAVARSNFGQWLYDHRKLIKNVSVAVLVVAVVTFLIVQAFIAINN